MGRARHKLAGSCHSLWPPAQEARVRDDMAHSTLYTSLGGRRTPTATGLKRELGPQANWYRSILALTYGDDPEGRLSLRLS